jgi:hypothetical protein
MACGYFSLVQDILTEEVDIPVFTSPLLLVPLISKMISHRRKVGILAASQTSLTEDFLKPAGIDDSVPYVLEGLDAATEFHSCFMGGTRTNMDVNLLQEQVVGIAQDFVESNPDMGALLLECSALPPFAAAIQREIDLPVFDYISFVHCVYRAVVQREYQGLM